jgi:hypothetical protein
VDTAKYGNAKLVFTESFWQEWGLSPTSCACEKLCLGIYEITKERLEMWFDGEN